VSFAVGRLSATQRQREQKSPHLPLTRTRTHPIVTYTVTPSNLLGGPIPLGVLSLGAFFAG